MNDPNPFQAQLTEYAQAILAKDADRLASLYGAGLRVFDAWDRWSFDDLASWRENLEGWLGSLGDERVRVEFDDARHVAMGDMGLLTAIVTYAAMDEAGIVLRSLESRLSWTLVREEGRWRIVHEHTSLPVRFADHKAMLRRER